MQRGSAAVTRNVLIGSASIILLLIVLYYMKRVEVNRLKNDLGASEVRRNDRENELNGKLTEYLQKLEDMTRQMGDLNSRLQECEDNKATLVMEVQKCKSTSAECATAKDSSVSELETVRAELKHLKSQQETVNSQLSDNQHSIANVRQALADAERELQQCEEDRDSINDRLRQANTVYQECQQRESNCQSALRGGGGAAAFHQSQLPSRPVNGLPERNSNPYLQLQELQAARNAFAKHQLPQLPVPGGNIDHADGIGGGAPLNGGQAQVPARAAEGVGNQPQDHQGIPDTAAAAPSLPPALATVAGQHGDRQEEEEEEEEEDLGVVVERINEEMEENENELGVELQREGDDEGGADDNAGADADAGGGADDEAADERQEANHPLDDDALV